MSQTFQLLCINLPESADRRDRMAAQAEALGLRLDFVPAVRGAALSAAERAPYDAWRRRLTWTDGLSDRELGCLMSHRKALGTFLKSEARFLVLLEDDSAFDPAFQQVVEELIALAPGWDLVRLETRLHDDPGREVGALPCGRKLVIRRKWTLGGAATLFSRASAERFLKNTERFFEAYDNLLGRPWVAGGVILELDRPVVKAGGFASTIETDGPPGARPAGPKKRERSWWRALTGLQRKLLGPVAARRAADRLAQVSR